MRDLGALDGTVRCLERGEDGGAFVVRLRGRNLRVIASYGMGWDHVSVSLPDRIPSWEEMDFVKRKFFHDDEWAMQLHAPPSEHINVHPFTPSSLAKSGATDPDPSRAHGLTESARAQDQEHPCSSGCGALAWKGNPRRARTRADGRPLSRSPVLARHRARRAPERRAVGRGECRPGRLMVSRRPSPAA